ncbi:MAG: flagellar motor protein MotB [Nitrospinota bacterium]|jgi:chemotaxis protein MotB|nr:flagellar motor protein MotB [Nitrospinota bacterium]
MSNSPPPAPPEKKPDQPAEWLMTFGDMMALLLTFFVLLIGISSPDPGKFDQAIKSIADALGAAPVSTETLMVAEKESEASFENLGNQVKEIINEGNMQDVVEVEVNEKGIVLNIVGGALFKSGGARVTKGIKPLILEVGLMVKKLPYKIIVEGHTDSSKTRGGRYPSNWELSAARAAAVVRVMVEVAGVGPERFSAVGYAEFRPLYAQTKANRAKNRRVEIIISREGQGS